MKKLFISLLLQIPALAWTTSDISILQNLAAYNGEYAAKGCTSRLNSAVTKINFRVLPEKDQATIEFYVDYSYPLVTEVWKNVNQGKKADTNNNGWYYTRNNIATDDSISTDVVIYEKHFLVKRPVQRNFEKLEFNKNELVLTLFRTRFANDDEHSSCRFERVP